MTGTRPILSIGMLALFLALLAGCGSKAGGRSTLGTKIGDREVKASLDGGGFISSEGDTATIRFAGRKVVVERGAVRLHDQEAIAELAKLPEDAKLVEVDYTAGKLTIAADGKEIGSMIIGK